MARSGNEMNWSMVAELERYENNSPPPVVYPRLVVAVEKSGGTCMR